MYLTARDSLRESSGDFSPPRPHGTVFVAAGGLGEVSGLPGGRGACGADRTGRVERIAGVARRDRIAARARRVRGAGARNHESWPSGVGSLAVTGFGRPPAVRKPQHVCFGART